MRRVVDAMAYVVRTGCQWRQLPLDFPPWQTVYRYFCAWRDTGVIRAMQRYVSLQARVAADRDLTPTVLCIDSQSVKTSKAGEDRGYDGGKRVKGRKRHIVVDTNGILIDAAVTAANVHDKTGAKRVIERVSRWLKPFPSLIHVDGGYGGKPFAQWVKSTVGAALEISVNLAQKVKRFVPAKARWVVERTFAWFSNYRRLDKDHEQLKRSSLAMIRLAMTSLALKRLAN